MSGGGTYAISRTDSGHSDLDEIALTENHPRHLLACFTQLFTKNPKAEMHYVFQH